MDGFPRHWQYPRYSVKFCHFLDLNVYSLKDSFVVFSNRYYFIYASHTTILARGLNFFSARYVCAVLIYRLTGNEEPNYKRPQNVREIYRFLTNNPPRNVTFCAKQAAR